MNLYPVFLNIENRLAVIAGAGEVAYRKIKDLLECRAKIKIISPEIHNEIKKLAKDNPKSIEIINREYKHGDINGAYIAFAATGYAEVNKAIFAEAEEKKIPVNSIDDPDNCTFFVPAVSRRGSFVLAVSTGGDSPALAAKLRTIFEKSIPGNIEEMLSSLSEARKILKKIDHLSSNERGEILKKIIGDELLLKKLIESHSRGKAEETIKSLLK